MRAHLLAILGVLIGAAKSFAAEVDYSKAPIETLISDLTLVQTEAPGLQSTATWRGFIGDDSPPDFMAGIIGSPLPGAVPQMRELVRRGPRALAALIRHLRDARPTKLAVGIDSQGWPGRPTVGTQIFGKEYDPRTPDARSTSCNFSLSCEEKSFQGEYVVRVGDIAFGLIGQIVNRALTPVRYQPTAILIVNSPVETPEIASLVRRDWSGVDADGLRVSLFADLRGEFEDRYSPALARLRLYYRDAYDALDGLDLKKRLAFENEEQRARQKAAEAAQHPAGPPIASSGSILDSLVGGCQPLAACLEALDEGIRKRSGRLGNVPAVARHLETFGEAAKKALLERATDPDERWRWAAGDLLGQWRTLSEQDIGPLLVASRMQRGRTAAYALARIGSPEAIRALARRIEIYGNVDVTGEALASLGSKALPHLLPVLMNDDRWMDATAIIGKMGQRAAPGDWGVLAADPRRPIDERIAALRGLSAMGEQARGTGDAIAPLLHSRDARLRAAADDALTKMHYPAVIERDVRGCVPLSDAFSSRGSDGGCLGRIASYGGAAAEFGRIIAERFLDSPNGSDRRDAATALGYIDDQAAAPRLIELLSDPDWRVVYASARALGWLGSQDAIPALERVAATHWLMEVRAQAQSSASVMRTPEQRIAKRAMGSSSSQDDVFAPNPVIGSVPPACMGSGCPPACMSGKWSWQGEAFQHPATEQLSIAVPASGGRAAGRMSGSAAWSGDGAFAWEPLRGRRQILRGVGVRGIHASSDGVVALLGETADFRYSASENMQASYGGRGLRGEAYALHAIRDGAGNWRLNELARLPLGADSFASIGPDLYAAWSSDRVVVFSLQGILGLATCVEAQ